MPEDIENAIETSAQGPAEAATDAGRVRQHPLGDLIEADRYLASKQAARSKGLGIRITKLVPPGAS